ncbi:MAG: tyrosine--tRNA ligase [bacterium]|jgi:tyrosyl-tRNA synthetase|nr:tyrosine--tRNA ligase [bacterium]
MTTRPDFPDYLAEMKWRGFFEQCTDEVALQEAMAAGALTGYAGFDPTADSLHVGSLVPIMGLVHLQRHGHRPIAIVGGGTAMVGDPSGKTELRRMLTVADIDLNLVGIRAQLGRFIRLGDGPGDGLMINNADWLRDKGYIEFLRDVGRHFSVNQMLTRDSVKTRMETGLSFLEFNYMILQAYDFLMLNRDYDCRLQVGGSDQWGNICSGIDLCRRVSRAEVFGLTYPLIATASGEKMGKTAAGAVWLDAGRTSPYEFFQYWVNVDDRDVSRFLRLYTLLSPARITELEGLQGADIRTAKAALAREVTTLVHGADAAAAAESAARAAFGGGGDAESIPSSRHAASEFAGDGLALLDVLTGVGLVESKGEARRLVRQGGVRVNGEAVADEQRRLTAVDVQDGRIVLQLGKKRHHHLRLGE